MTITHPLARPLDLTLLTSAAIGSIALATAPILPLPDPLVWLRRGVVITGAASAIALQTRWRGQSPDQQFVHQSQTVTALALQAARAAEQQAAELIAAKEREQEAVYQQWQEMADRQAEEARALVEQTHAECEAVVAGYAQRLAVATAPKWFEGADLVSFVGRQIQEILWQSGVECDADRGVETDSEHYLWLRPRSLVKLKDVQAAAEQIPAYVDGIFETPSVTLSGGVILLRYAFNQPAAKAQAKAREEAMVLDGFDWMRSCVLDSVHDLVAGQTGSGKSTLIANLIDLAQSVMAQEWRKDPTIWIVDPKWPDSEWRMGGRKVDPHYRGFDRYTDPNGQSYPCALDGYRAMDGSVRDRLGAAQDDWFHDRETERDPEIWVCDEGEQMAASYGNDAADPVQFVARVGRSTKVRLILIGQSPKCSAYKFRTISQLNNFTRYYLGEAILGAIDEIGRTTIEKNRLRKTLQKLESVALTDADKRYFCLVKQPSRPVYFAYLPPPGYFLQSNAPAAEPEPAPIVSMPALTQAIGRLADQELQDLVETAKADEARLMADHDRRRSVLRWDETHPNGRMLDRLADCWPEITVKSASGEKSARSYRQAREELARLFPEKYPSAS